MIRLKKYFLLLFTFIFPAFLYSEKRVVIFTPTSENNTYWPIVYRFLESAADDLDMVIEIYEFDVQNRFAKNIDGVQILREMVKPDAAIFSVAFGQAKPLAMAAEELGIPFFLQGPLFPSELPEIGGSPRNELENWIGYFYQNEEDKGYILGKELIDMAIEKKLHDENGYINVIGIGGGLTWFGSELRENGLRRAVDEYSEARLLQIVPTQWTQEEGRTKTSLLLNRYSDISVVWTASDQLAMGASEALEESELNREALTGGLDFSLNGLYSVQNSEIAATVASTMFSYAEILIYLFDYLNGIDFIHDIGTEIQTGLYTATTNNVHEYLDLYSNLESIDFRIFSKVYNDDLEKYDFSLKTLEAAIY
ncbi:MAG: ABC transporter substrate-binding protein [Spirochaetaceae bacterium]|jgi:ABC-type sugar transport system substrate-binding protein|nr:ABC transporter substrate-binding protein [Spirochaetaceae bacterium]